MTPSPALPPAVARRLEKFERRKVHSDAYLRLSDCERVIGFNMDAARQCAAAGDRETAAGYVKFARRYNRAARIARLCLSPSAPRAGDETGTPGTTT